LPALPSPRSNSIAWKRAYAIFITKYANSQEPNRGKSENRGNDGRPEQEPSLVELDSVPLSSHPTCVSIRRPFLLNNVEIILQRGKALRNLPTNSHGIEMRQDAEESPTEAGSGPKRLSGGSIEGEKRFGVADFDAADVRNHLVGASKGTVSRVCSRDGEKVPTRTGESAR